MGANTHLESVDKGLLIYRKVTQKSKAPSRAQRYLVKKDILFQMVRPYQKNNYFFDIDDKNEYVSSSGYAQIRAKYESRYLYQLLHTEYFNNTVQRLCTGTSYPAIKSSDLSAISISYCGEAEQKKIANFLSTVDKKINLLKEKYTLFEQYKKGVMQKLFSQEIRFKDENGDEFADWLEDRIDGYVERVRNPVAVEIDSTYREIGVRSHAKGVFHKKPIKGAELGNKRVFWVHPNAFVVNIVFAWEHAVALTTEKESGFIASHRFPMFVPKNSRVDLRFFTIFFRRKKGKYLLGVASPGGAGRNKTLGQSEFSRIKVTFPCLEEQKRIADFHAILEEKLKLVSEQIENTQVFKKGLLQQMFV